MSLEPFETAQAHGMPLVRQLSIFIENRVGQLQRLTRLLDETDVHILALSVVNAIDCAILRIIVDQPDEAHSLFSDSGFSVSETEILVVSLPHGKRGLLEIWTGLMTGEINILYTYPLLIQPHGSPAIALQTDNRELAVDVLRRRRFDVLDQSDLVKHPDD